LPPELLFLTQICTKSIVCRLGPRPRPHWGAYSAPPDPLAGSEGGAPRGKGRREGRGKEGRGSRGGQGRGKEGRKEEGGEGVPECPNPQLASLVVAYLTLKALRYGSLPANYTVPASTS